MTAAVFDRLRLNRFLVLGRVGMDLVAEPRGTRIEDAATFSAAIGGSAGNIAVALARQGASVALVSALSDDPVARFCRAELARYGVDCTHIATHGGERRTSLALTETIADPCQTVIYRNHAADLALTPADVESAPYAAAAALVVTGTALAAEPSRAATFRAIDLARAAGAAVVLDIDWRAYSWPSVNIARDTCAAAARLSDMIVGNDVEFGLLAGTHAAGESFAATLAHDRIAIYKRGPDGATTFAHGTRFDTPVFAVTALKPTGAGDGFMGGLLAALARGAPLPDAVRHGAATAAIVVSRPGCAPAMPDSGTLTAFLANR